ncbi:ATP-binding protein [Stutzerimonas nitrititolerans]|jgi:hypothetical protein|uniref:ATP-binding protein n=1 Tax=Stutzerimonas nitrititolerans TaxID=2482751 RepID=UPI000597BE7B|nr:ATP-binding protein [Stutzerimonas nitrititolerans]KIL03163.1 hypothetical protein QX25_18425 [Stutzerimonas stutzeri]
MSKTEKRAFNVHPGIIQHLIREQAGTLVKAVAELIMNSIDAGATRVDLDFDEQGKFSVVDDGRGFLSRTEIEAFFETFGTPHQEGDATFGRFRIGRGQIMAFANTRWRTGNFIMDVRLLDSGAEFGYTLTETEDYQPGCRIDGQIVSPDVIREAYYAGLSGEQLYNGFSDECDFYSMIRFVGIPVYVSGHLLNTLPADNNWSHEDEFGYYLFDNSHSLSIYNQGVFVCDTERRSFSVAGLFVSKRAIKLNMARNAWLRHECEVIQHLRSVAHNAYVARIESSARMTDSEAGAIIRRIATESDEIDENEARILVRSKFIPSLAGQRISPFQFLDATQFSLYDGHSSLVAERAEKEEGFCFLTPQLFDLANLKVSAKNALLFLEIMVDVFSPFIINNQDRVLVQFDELLEAYSGTFEEIPDAELPPKQLAALRAIRHVASQIKQLTKDPARQTRKMIAGKSDCSDAWTNGINYIAFNTAVLEQAYLTRWSGGIERLVNLAIHEFCHQAHSSVDTHEHTLEFYQAYHEATLANAYCDIVRRCTRFYLKQLCKAGQRISSVERTHTTAIGKMLLSMGEKFPVKKERKDAPWSSVAHPTPPKTYRVVLDFSGDERISQDDLVLAFGKGWLEPEQSTIGMPITSGTWVARKVA